jgi:hypothetical protein
MSSAVDASEVLIHSNRSLLLSDKLPTIECRTDAEQAQRTYQQTESREPLAKQVGERERAMNV